MDNFDKIRGMNLADLEKKDFPDGIDTQSSEEVSERELANTQQISTEKMEKEKALENLSQTVEVQEGSSSEEENSEKTDPESVTVEEETLPEQKMADPIGRHYYIEAEVTPKELTAFLFGHNYRQPVMILATVIGVVWPIMAIVTKRGNLMLSLMTAAIFLVFFPLSTVNKGRNAKKLNPAYEKVFHYMIDEWGLHLELGEEAVDVEWKKIYKFMFLKSVVVLYTGRSNAFLIPINSMGERAEEILAFLKEMKKKNR